MVPFSRNVAFVGREKILSQVLEKIPPGTSLNSCQRTAINGLGGVGKTQIALEAAFRVHEASPDCSVFWVPAINEATFTNAYRAIGIEIGLKGLDEETADVKSLVKAALSRSNAGRWLLIVDNADDSKLLFGPTGISTFLPTSRSGSILFTTRTYQIAAQLLGGYQNNIVSLAKMVREDATKMLWTKLRPYQMQDEASTTRLLQFLDYLPLAISQAAAYMVIHRRTTTEYLEYCMSSDGTLIDLLSREFEDLGRYDTIKNPIATTYVISFEHLSRNNPQAGEYLRFISFLHEKGIPKSLLPQTNSQQAMDEALTALATYGFITEREESGYFDMHRLVRLATGTWLKQEQTALKSYRNVVRRMKKVYENREVWMKYLPHALNVLDCGREFGDQAEDSGLLFRVAVGLCDQEDHERGVTMFRRTLTLSLKTCGQTNFNTLKTMVRLGGCLHHSGQCGESERLLLDALAFSKSTLGKAHPLTLRCTYELGNVLTSQHKGEEAEELLKQALRLCNTDDGGHTSNTEWAKTLIRIQISLSTAFSGVRKFEEAENMLRHPAAGSGSLW